MKMKKAIAIFLTCVLSVTMVFQPVFAVSPAKNPKTTLPKLTTEQANECARLGKIMREQSLAADAEQVAHEASGKTPTVKLDVTNVLQYPEFPNGCEVTALSMLLLYSGKFYIDKTLLNSYLPSTPFTTKCGLRASGDPETTYCGDPRKTDDGFYCFENPLIECGNKIIKEYDLDIELEKLDKADETELVAQLDKGNPVVAWTTVSNGAPLTFDPYGWVDQNTGKWTEPYWNLHVVVLTGYDDEYFYISDPLKGDIVAKRSSFMSAYTQMGSRAIIANEKPAA